MPKMPDPVRRAIDWLRANPDRHIKENLAVDSDGNVCSPIAPYAQCFCVLGRIAKEMDLKSRDPLEAYESLELRRMLPKYEGLDQDDPQTYIHVYGRNDRSRPDTLTTPACPSSNIKLSGPQVLNWLEGQYDKNPE